MNEIISKIIKAGLHGENTHLHPNKALQDLSAEKARKKPSPNVSSCWEILHHIAVWQKFCLELIKGNKPRWETVKEEEWPSQERLSEDTEWDGLVSKFKKDLQETAELAGSIDPMKPMPGWRNAPAIQALLMLAQHNSYHLGQIVTIRKTLGYWSL